MLVALGEVEPDPQCREQCGDHRDEYDRRVEDDRQYGPEERRDGEVGAETRCADMPHRNDEEHRADS